MDEAATVGDWTILGQTHGMRQLQRRHLLPGIALAALVCLGVAGYTFHLEVIHALGLAPWLGWVTAAERLETEWYVGSLGGMRGWRVSAGEPDWYEGEFDFKFRAKRGLVLHEVVLKLVEDTGGERPRTLVSIPLAGAENKALSASQEFNQQGAIRIPATLKRHGQRRLILTAQLRYPAHVATQADASVSVAQDQSQHPNKYRLYLEAWRQ